jgi:prepilin-type N-terminal cleavage/methylation domain-containing protein
MRNRRAFSLIELLVVIAVISLLASILLPTANQIRERAYCVVCLNNMRQLGVAHSVYTVDNKGSFPLVLHDPGGSHPHVRWGGHRQHKYPKRVYIDQIWGTYSWAYHPNYPPGKYLADYRVFYCPGALRHRTYSGGEAYRTEEQLFKPGGDHRQNVLGYLPFFGGSDQETPPAPLRLVAKRAPLKGSSNGMCWLFCARLDKVKPFWDPCFRTDLAPHYVGKRNIFSIPYNVVHLDGHADTHQYDPEYYSNSSWRHIGHTGQGPYGLRNGVQETGLDTDNDRRR